MIYEIGNLITDDDGNLGIVCIKWNDGDICTFENDAAHPNPRHLTNHQGRLLVLDACCGARMFWFDKSESDEAQCPTQQTK